VDPGGEAIRGAVAPLKPTKVTLFTVILYDSEYNIRHTMPFCRHCFVTAVLRSILHLSHSSKAVMRIDSQTLLKSLPLTLLAGPAPENRLILYLKPPITMKGIPTFHKSDYSFELEKVHCSFGLPPTR